MRAVSKLFVLVFAFALQLLALFAVLLSEFGFLTHGNSRCGHLKIVDVLAIIFFDFSIFEKCLDV